MPLLQAVENQACPSQCCSASLRASGNALFCERNITCVIGNSYCFTTWTHGSARVHASAHTCRQVLKQPEASTPFFPMAFAAYAHVLVFK